MQILLLAAGFGSRLSDHTKNLPKTLLELDKKPICYHILDRLGEFPLNKIVAVGGFEFDQLKAAIVSYLPNIDLVFNEDYPFGNLISLLKGKEKISQSFYVMNADHVFSLKILKKVFDDKVSKGNRITLVCDFDRKLGSDDMKILQQSDGSLLKMSKQLEDYQGGYIGISFIPKEKLGIYWETATEVLKKHGKSVCVEEIMNELACQGETINILDASGSLWLEVDTPEDFERASKLIGRLDGEGHEILADH